MGWEGRRVYSDTKVNDIPGFHVAVQVQGPAAVIVMVLRKDY